MPAIAVQRLWHANVVVHDLQATARAYARIFGITHWDVQHWTPQRLSASQAFGYRMQFGYSTATGSTASGITFRLVQPTHGFSTFTEYLITRGEGIHSLCATRLDAAELESLRRSLPAHNLMLGQAASPDRSSHSLMLDTREQLGGFLVEVATPLVAPADEQWDLADEAQRPPAVEWLTRIPRIGHFGIAVSNLMRRLPAYERLLGLERWSAVHFSSAPGSLEYSTCNGQAVDNAWLIAITDVSDFGLELLQGTREPTDYQQTIARSGEGIHHVLVRRDVAEEEWWALRAWMESMNIGIVMSGRVRGGAAEFFYLDTRQALGGYLLEVIVTRQAAQTATAAPPARFDLDLSVGGS